MLILDNCEHLAAECADITATLLQACPRLQFVVTSREPMQVTVKQLWQVPPLTLPYRLHRTRRHRKPCACSSIRARIVRPDFTLDDRTARTVADICTQLHGLPLALELAAARVNVLGIEQIAARLDHRLTLLTSGPRTAPPRQQTLRAVLDWSYALLYLNGTDGFSSVWRYSPAAGTSPRPKRL